MNTHTLPNAGGYRTAHMNECTVPDSDDKRINSKS